MEKEIVFIGDGTLTIDPDEFEEEILSLDEYVTKVKKYPSLLFNAFQRTYTALRMFGKEQSTKPGKPDRWRFLDDRVDKPNKKIGMGALYGVEDAAEQIMAYLFDACISSDAQGRFVLLFGPPSSAKTNLIELIATALDGFAILPEGAVYTIRWKLGDVSELFGGLDSITCPAHENPINFIPRKKLNTLLKNINKNKLEWQKTFPRTTRCPACSHIIKTLKNAGKLKDLSERIEVVRLFPRVDVARYEFRPTAEKAYDKTVIFGGSIDFERLSRFMRKDHPLVQNFGIGGRISGPCPQRHLVHFSEMYKGGQEFLEEMLDLVQSRTIILDRGGHEVPVDALFIGTTNLEEFEKMKAEPTLAEWLTSRAIPIGMGHLLVLDDQTEALERRVFHPSDRRLSYHIPPHFVREVLATVAVLGALDEPKSELKITLLQKARVYNGEMPHGLEYNLDELFKELWSEAHDKTSSDIREGIRRGVPFRFFQELPIKFAYAISKLPPKLRGKYTDDQYTGCVGMLTIKSLLEGIVKRYDGMNSETRTRIIKEALPIAWGLYEEFLARDVNKAILGEQRIINLAIKYLFHCYESVRGRKEYLDLRGQKRPIDEEFMKDIEKASGVKNPKEFREALAAHVRYRRSDFTATEGGERRFAVDKLAKQLLEENLSFRKAVEGYAITRILPNLVDDVDVWFSETNEALVKELKKMGYCSACAQIAIQAASRKRKSE